MDDSHKLKITFFFGAGAEGRDNFGIATGFEYLKSSLYSKEYMADFTGALSKYFPNKYFNKNYKYTIHTFDANNFLLKSFIKHKILSSTEFLKSYEAEICALLSSYDFNELKEELDEDFKSNLKSLKDIELLSIKTEFNDILTGTITHYSDIKSEFLKDLFTEKLGKIDFDINIGTAGYLDSYFHTIINPSKYGKIKFSKIFNYYWASYFTILKGVLLYLSKSSDQFNKYFCGNQLNYSEVLKDINNLTDTIYKLTLS